MAVNFCVNLTIDEGEYLSQYLWVKKQPGEAVKGSSDKGTQFIKDKRRHLMTLIYSKWRMKFFIKVRSRMRNKIFGKQCWWRKFRPVIGNRHTLLKAQVDYEVDKGYILLRSKISWLNLHSTIFFDVQWEKNELQGVPKVRSSNFMHYNFWSWNCMKFLEDVYFSIEYIYSEFQ